MPEESAGSPSELSTFKPYQTILDQEVEQAQEELGRPAAGLFLSGLLAGFGVSVSALLVAVILSTQGGAAPTLSAELLAATAYATGFILVIMGRTDLFTEYTTMAILPVLVGRAGIARLLRLWGLVFVANVLGAAGFAALAAQLGPRLGVVEAPVFAQLAHELVDLPWWVIVLSSSLSGWLMGLLAWLLGAARDTTSQVLFIWLVAGAIGLLHLHHSITGTAEVVAGVLTAPGLTLASFGHFLLWTTLGNVLGSVVFAVLIRHSVVLGTGRGSRQAGS